MSSLVRRRRTDRETEETALSPLATKSIESAGRALREPDDPYRTCFERDRDRIVHSKAFRRLKHKTQVFINPTGDHTVTRLTHTLQVAQVARSIAAALSLNEPLAEAIALGHDVGHTPFGHIGEEALATFFEDGWVHSAQSVRIFDVLEPLNLCEETRDGILRHPWKVDPGPRTPEAQTVRFADRIAYLTHDVLDAVRADLLKPADLPAVVTDTLGQPGNDWIGHFIEAVIDYSVTAGEVGMDPALLPVMHELRAFMFKRVYLGPEQHSQTQAAKRVVLELVTYLLEHPEEITDSYADPEADTLTRVADFVAGMTDRYALMLHDRWFRPRLFSHP
ncbi:HD domain-containing protein [Euzebya tangerina]|uniref:HD domain-containing protein n=1 Tax=Euzebya tangerina TaxID=591198 RepID=UPI000E31494A|nr:HD domain-containing protein [Euzebya tangerina]